jgi:acetamidase/formamidase
MGMFFGIMPHRTEMFADFFRAWGALQMATSGMMRWLDRDYKLTPSEAAMVMGFAIQYDVVDLVGTQVSIAAKLPKAALQKLDVPRSSQ